MSININSLLSTSALDRLNSTSSTSATSNSNEEDYTSLLSSLGSTDSSSISSLANLLSDSSSSTSNVESLLNQRTEILKQKYELSSNEDQTDETTTQLKSLQGQLDAINEQLANALLEQESSSSSSSYLTDYGTNSSSSSNDLSSLFELSSQISQLKMLNSAKTSLENQSKLLKSEVNQDGESSTAYSKLQKVNANLDLLNNQIVSSLNTSDSSNLLSVLNSSSALTQYQLLNSSNNDSKNNTDDTLLNETNTALSI